MFLFRTQICSPGAPIKRLTFPFRRPFLPHKFSQGNKVTDVLARIIRFHLLEAGRRGLAFLETHGCEEEWLSEKKSRLCWKEEMCYDWGEKERVLAWQWTQCLLTHTPQQRAFLSGGAMHHCIQICSRDPGDPTLFFFFFTALIIPENDL